MIAFIHYLGLDGGDVRAGVGLGETGAAEFFAGDKGFDVFFRTESRPHSIMA